MRNQLHQAAFVLALAAVLFPKPGVFGADRDQIPDDISIQYNVPYREGTVRNWTLDLAMPKERGEKPRPADVVHRVDHKQVHTVIEKLLGGPPEGARLAEYKQASPVSYISAKLPPLMLIYGEADSQVGVETSDQFVEALRQAGLKDLTY